MSARRALPAVLLLILLALPAAALEDAWVLTTDYSLFGRLRGFLPTDPWTVSGDLGVVPGDPVGRWHDGRLYVVGRGGSNLIQVYDPADGHALVREFSLGSGRNPQDIAFDAAGEAYVSCYDQALLLRVDVQAGTVLETFSTAAFADADGLPETGWLLAVGDRLAVTCQRLDRDNWYAPAGPGQLAVFDMAAEAWVDVDAAAPGLQAIELAGGNPYCRLERETGTGDGHHVLRVGCVGYYGLADGGIDRVDLTTATSLGYLVTEADLGGDLTGFTGTGPASLHVLVSDASFVTSLRRVALHDGTVTVLDTGSGYVHADLAWDGGDQLFVADRTTGAAGLRVFDVASGAELTQGVVATGLPPFQIVLPDRFEAAVPPPLAVGPLRMGAPYPNPCNPRAEVRFTGPAETAVRVSVFDLKGRRLASDTIRLDGTGEVLWRFRGRDDRGRTLAAGVYRIVGQSPAGFVQRRVTLLK